MLSLHDLMAAKYSIGALSGPLAAYVAVVVQAITEFTFLILTPLNNTKRHIAATHLGGDDEVSRWEPNAPSGYIVADIVGC